MALLSENLSADGWSSALPSQLSSPLLETLRQTTFSPAVAGQRCILDKSPVRRVACEIKAQLSALGVFAHAIAIQAIAFDKSPGANWKVAWHQDLMFPFAAPATSPGFDLPTKKDGIDYARPPVPVLENLLAVRLHLDDCDHTNGPLRVCPGSHRLGIIPAREASSHVEKQGELAAIAQYGDIVLMRPLTLHASSQAAEPRHRRVLHFVYYSGPPLTEGWYRSV